MPNIGILIERQFMKFVDKVLDHEHLSCLLSCQYGNESERRFQMYLGTQEIRFGRKTNEIAKYSILDEKRNSQFWTKFGRKTANLSPNLMPSVIEVHRKGV